MFFFSPLFFELFQFNIINCKSPVAISSAKNGNYFLLGFSSSFFYLQYCGSRPSINILLLRLIKLNTRYRALMFPMKTVLG